MPKREFDVALSGATGFTGRKTVRYFAQFAPPDLNWAIAGRNLSKLEALKSGVPVIVADSSDQTAIDNMVKLTGVLLTTAGPFALYGTGIVDACVRLRTHYCDITGETPWVRGLIDRCSGDRGRFVRPDRYRQHGETDRGPVNHRRAFCPVWYGHRR